MEPEAEDDFEIVHSDQSPEERFVHSVVGAIQEIFIGPDFDALQQGLLSQKCESYDYYQKQPAEWAGAFASYQKHMLDFLQPRLTHVLGQMSLLEFIAGLKQHNVDEQISDTLLSFADIEGFKALLKDYHTVAEEKERFLVLTQRTQKISENKKVKGKDNIFSSGDSNPLGLAPLKPLAPMPKNKTSNEKTQEELLVPDLILSVRPMRKSNE